MSPSSPPSPVAIPIDVYTNTVMLSGTPLGRVSSASKSGRLSVRHQSNESRARLLRHSKLNKAPVRIDNGRRVIFKIDSDFVGIVYVVRLLRRCCERDGVHSLSSLEFVSKV